MPISVYRIFLHPCLSSTINSQPLIIHFYDCRYQQVVDEYLVEQARRRQEEEDHNSRWRAAVSIQARWRGWKVRRALAASNKRKSKRKNKK